MSHIESSVDQFVDLCISIRGASEEDVGERIADLSDFFQSLWRKSYIEGKRNGCKFVAEALGKCSGVSTGPQAKKFVLKLVEEMEFMSSMKAQQEKDS